MLPGKFTSAKGLEILVRRATEEDAEALIALGKLTLESYREFVLTTPEEFNPSLEQEKEFIRSHNVPGGFLAVAEAGKKLIGLVHLKPAAKKKIAHTGEFAIAVAPGYIEQKIGSALMDCLVDWAKSEPGIEKVILNVMQENKRAIHIYKKMGFVVEGVNVKALKQADGTYTNNVQMALFVK